MDSTPRTAESWHAWFTHQATWTQDTRQWLYTQVGLSTARSVLEVGCGTGVIAGEIARKGPAVVGLDIDATMLAVACREAPAGRYIQGDALALPFPDDTFDVVLCHYLLLWLADPIQGLREMVRVVRPGGAVLACAEPDYGGRIDHPPELVPLGQLQAESLRRQGANPSIGRKLGELLAAAGLEATVGTMAGRWARPSPESLAAEWAMRRHDLAGLLPPEELARLEQVDQEAAAAGRRVLFVPTFYAWGRKGLPGERISARPGSARAPDEDRPGARADGADGPAANLRPVLPTERDDYTWTVMNILSHGDLSMAAVMRSRFLTWWARRVLHFYFHRFCRPLVLEVEGTPSGFLVLRVRKDALRVEAVGVLPAYRQQGWGMWLLEWAAQEAGRLGLARLELHVSSGNRPALTLYAKAGFHPVPRAWRGFQMERVLEKKSEPQRQDQEMNNQPAFGGTRAMWLRVGTWLLLAVTVVYLILVGGELLRQAREWPTLHRDRDFPSYYLAARRLLHGQDTYSGLQEDARDLGIAGYFIDSAVNPPTFTVATFWLALFPYAVSWGLWQALSLAALVGTLALLMRAARWPPDAASRLRLVCAALLFPPLAFHMLYAHTELLLLLVLTAAWVGLRRGKEVPAGLLLGLAAALRVYPLFFLLYLLLRRSWKAFFAAVGGGLALAGLAAVVAGPASFMNYLTVLRAEVTSLYARWGNFSLWGVVHKLASIWTALEARPVLRDNLALALSAGLLLLTLWLVRRPGAAPADLDREYGLFLVAALLASPLSWIYYQVLLYLPLLLLLRDGRGRRPAVSVGLAAALVAALSPVVVGIGELPLALERTLAFLPTLTLLGVYLALVWERPPRTLA